MPCRQCSAELPEGSAFCNRCGASQDDERPARPFPAGATAAPTATAPEETLWTGSYALKSVAHLWLLAALWMAGVAVAWVNLPGKPDPRARWGALGVALLPAVLVLLQGLVRKLALRYRLSNHRLFTVRGIFSRQHDELELIRVDDVSVRQNLLQRWFGVGTVTVLSTDSSNPRLEMQGIERPLELKELIRAQVRARRARTTFLENL
jgi:uncharacterized membrane protein YdbT with pleckstrin-like domain